MKKTTSSSKVKAKPTPAPAKAAASSKTAATKPVAEKAPTASVKVKTPAAPIAPKAVKAPKAVAPKAVAPKEPVALPVASTTTLIAVADVGFGNQLFVRGEGAGLSWDRGIELQNVAADKWQVSLQANGSPLTFKFLVNDLTWSAGEDYVAQAGGTVTLQPVFE